MYDGRKIEALKDFPMLDNYYSDWHQLTFTFEKKGRYYGIYAYEEDQHGGIHSQVFAINLAKFPKDFDSKNSMEWEFFMNAFLSIWMHEWFHLVGLSEEGIAKIKELGFPVG